MVLFGRIVGRINHLIHNNFAIINGFHTSSNRQIDQKYRRKHRLTENPNAFGPLTNLPDYSYTDGRPTPFGVRLYARIIKQREYLQKIRQLVAEVDFAVENHERRTQEKEAEKRRIIENKLKPKGQILLNERNS